MANTILFSHFTFNLPLKPYEIPIWRKAFLGMLPSASGLHDWSATDVVYPLIQFCRIGKQASIVAIHEGITAVQNAITDHSWDFYWQKQPYNLGIIQIDAGRHLFAHQNAPQHYCLQAYLPFSDESPAPIYWPEASLISKVEVLQERLNGHFQRFAAALQYTIPHSPQLQLTHLDRSKALERGINAPALFYLKFVCHWSLPPMLGLGEGLSQGLGRVLPYPAK